MKLVRKLHQNHVLIWSSFMSEPALLYAFPTTRAPSKLQAAHNRDRPSATTQRKLSHFSMQQVQEQ